MEGKMSKRMEAEGFAQARDGGEYEEVASLLSLSASVGLRWSLADLRVATA